MASCLVAACAGPTGTFADVTAVSTAGLPSQTVLTVTVSSPDLGCEQYADWWEVIDRDTGALLTRRILGHSHVDEQPFTRSGNAVDLDDNQSLIIRAHMNNAGYGGIEFHGTLAKGFSPALERAALSESLASQSPLPSGCAF